MIKPIIIFGIGDFGQLMQYYFTAAGAYQVVAFTVDANFKNKKEFCGLPVIDFNHIEQHFPPSEFSMFIAIGYPDFNQIRHARYLEAKQKGYEMASYIHSKATVSPELVIGENCCILENTSIQPFVRIGNNVIIWGGGHIGHHTVIGDNCFFAGGATLAGRVLIKENTFIGVGATITDFITVEKNNIIGANALVLKNTEENGVYTGMPAQRTNELAELQAKFTTARRLESLTLR